MLKSCQYCGRIHDAKFVCPPRKEMEEKRWSVRKKTGALSFRKTNAWTRMSQDIRKRDNNMCLCCKAKLQGTTRRFNTKDLSVHHITPIEEDYAQRLDGANLMTVCQHHHELCEAGIISRETQRAMVAESMRQAGEDKDAPLVY